MNMDAKEPFNTGKKNHGVKQFKCLQLVVDTMFKFNSTVTLVLFIYVT